MQERVKRAIMEGLAQRIVRRDVSDSINEKRVVSLDLGLLISERRYLDIRCPRGLSSYELLDSFEVISTSASRQCLRLWKMLMAK